MTTRLGFIKNDLGIYALRGYFLKTSPPVFHFHQSFFLNLFKPFDKRIISSHQRDIIYTKLHKFTL